MRALSLSGWLAWGTAGAIGLHAQSLRVDTPLDQLEAQARRDSNDAVTHYNLALGYWSKKKWNRVEPALRSALMLDKRFAPAYLALAYLPRAAGNFWTEHSRLMVGGRRFIWYTASDSVVDEFNRNYRHAFMIDPLVDIRIVVATEYRFGHVDRFDKALYAYNDGKWEEAHRRFGELLVDSSDYRGENATLLDRILWYHALASSRRGLHEEATRSLQRLIDRSLSKEAGDTLVRWPFRTNEYRYLLATERQRAKDPNGALALYREVLLNDLGLYMAHVRMADIYESAGMLSDAVDARRNALNANPDDPSLLLDLGKTLARANQWIDAEKALQDAVAANPRDPRPYYFLGVVEQHQNKKAEARSAFNDFLARAPTRYGPQAADAKQRLNALQ